MLDILILAGMMISASAALGFAVNRVVKAWQGR